MKLPAVTPARAARWFVVANIAFLGVDIVVAHLANDFARSVEWAPVVFSAFATLVLLFLPRLDRVVAAGAIAVGVAGMVLHLESGFFERQTLRDLVYSAPFVAPVSYVGVGLLLLLLRSEEAETSSLGPWILLLALGGFIGNFLLSLLDHAQNGFFRWSEWIPVGAAAYGVAFLALALVRPRSDRALVRATWMVMALEIVVGLVGAALHVLANLDDSAMTSFRDRFVFGAPAFAPLLFANLALLAMIGLWASSSGDDPAGATRRRSGAEQRAADR